MVDAKFPPMPTFMGKPLDTEALAVDAARCMIAEANHLTKENERLRDALREIATYVNPYAGAEEDFRAVQRIAEDALELPTDGDPR